MRFIQHLALLALIISVRAGATLAEQHARETPAITGREIHGGGDWKATTRRPHGPQQWSLDLVRGGDNAIRGRIAVANSPVIKSGGNVEGTITGDIVAGTISDDDGNRLASFEGQITPNGIRGKYADRTGEIGDWAWQGQLPK